MAITMGHTVAAAIWLGNLDHRSASADRASGPACAFARFDHDLRYAGRDALALEALGATTEDTPYGRLRLGDVVECARDPATDEHPHKEGGIRASWVGRRAYATWVRGVTVKEHAGEAGALRGRVAAAAAAAVKAARLANGRRAERGVRRDARSTAPRTRGSGPPPRSPRSNRQV